MIVTKKLLKKRFSIPVVKMYYENISKLFIRKRNLASFRVKF